MIIRIDDEKKLEVLKYLEEKGIAFETADSSHQMVVIDEIESMKETLRDTMEDRWEDQNLSKEEIDERMIIVEAELRKLEENPLLIVGQDYSFLSVLDMIDSTLTENCEEIIPNF